MMHAFIERGGDMPQNHKTLIRIIFGVILILCILLLLIRFHVPRGYWPPQGVVPKESTAIGIAEAVLLQLYGEHIYNTMPFVAEYDSTTGVWTVRGTPPINSPGGVPEIKILGATGEVLHIAHGK